MENNNYEITTNNEVTDVTTELAETTSGSALETLLKVGVIVGAIYGICKLVKKIKAKKEAAENVVPDETVEEQDVEEND